MKRINIRIKYFLKEIKRKLKYNFFKDKTIITKNENVYIFLAADYRNLGDVAITYAQKKFLSKIYKNYNIVEIPFMETYKYMFSIKKNITKRDIITIVGGGNMSEKYDALEEVRRMVIKNFKRNLIISFPQTIDFGNSVDGMCALKRSEKIYKSNKNLILCAREKMSYEKMKNYFKSNNVILIPDIVFSLYDNIELDTKRNNKIGICLRNDIEVLNNSIKNIIKDVYKDNKDIVKIDTYMSEEEFIKEKKYELLLNFIKQISKFKLVITDRLHCMIFCYLTHTPCIAFDNSNHKISSTYETWLNKCNYIKMIKEISNEKILQAINEVDNISVEKSNLLAFQFDKLKNILEEEMKNG